MVSKLLNKDELQVIVVSDNVVWMISESSHMRRLVMTIDYRGRCYLSACDLVAELLIIMFMSSEEDEFLSYNSISHE